MTIDDTIKGYCPNCGEKAEFQYIGLQVYSNTYFKMYNCQLCTDTLSENTIKLYSRKREDIEKKERGETS